VLPPLPTTTLIVAFALIVEGMPWEAAPRVEARPLLPFLIGGVSG